MVGRAAYLRTPKPETTYPCQVCGGTMYKSGQKRHGRQRYRCIVNGITCSTILVEEPSDPRHSGGRRSYAKLPERDELAALLQAYTYKQIAAMYKCSRHSVGNAVYRHGLKGISPHGATKLAKPKKPATGTGHEQRTQAEYDPAVTAWAKRSWGKPFGGKGWHNTAGLIMARAEQ